MHFERLIFVKICPTFLASISAKEVHFYSLSGRRVLTLIKRGGSGVRMYIIPYSYDIDRHVFINNPLPPPLAIRGRGAYKYITVIQIY